MTIQFSYFPVTFELHFLQVLGNELTDQASDLHFAFGIIVLSQAWKCLLKEDGRDPWNPLSPAPCLILQRVRGCTLSSRSSRRFCCLLYQLWSPRRFPWILFCLCLLCFRGIQRMVVLHLHSHNSPCTAGRPQWQCILWRVLFLIRQHLYSLLSLKLTILMISHEHQFQTNQPDFIPRLDLFVLLFLAFFL